MTPEHIRETYSELSETLTGLGLGWITHQVAEMVRSGRLVEKEARIFKDEEFVAGALPGLGEEMAPRRAGKSARMMTLEPWPADMQLLFLIDAVRHSIIYAASVENEQLQLLHTFDKIEAVHFRPDGEDDEARLFTVRGVEMGRLKRLGELLDALEREVEA